jgi:hypothetical protein
VKIKRLAAAAAPVGAAVLVTSYVAAPPAEAAPAGKGAILCDLDLCLQTDGVSPNGACVTTWAYNQTFYGHFELSVSNGFWVENTANESWRGGGPGSEFFGVPFAGANIVAKEWKYNRTTRKYTEIAHISFAVHSAGLNACP